MSSAAGSGRGPQLAWRVAGACPPVGHYGPSAKRLYSSEVQPPTLATTSESDQPHRPSRGDLQTPSNAASSGRRGDPCWPAATKLASWSSLNQSGRPRSELLMRRGLLAAKSAAETSDDTVRSCTTTVAASRAHTSLPATARQLLSGRSAVRIRSPAPRSGPVAVATAAARDSQSAANAAVRPFARRCFRGGVDRLTLDLRKRVPVGVYRQADLAVGGQLPGS